MQAVEKKLSERDADEIVFRGKLSETELKLENVADEARQQKDEIDELRRQLKEKDEEAKALEIRVSHLNCEICDLKAKDEKLRQEMTQERALLSSVIAQKETEISSKSQFILDLEKTISEIHASSAAEIEETRNAIAKKDEEIFSLKADAEKVKEELAKAEELRLSVEKQRDEQIRRLEEHLSEVNRDKDSLLNEISALREQSAKDAHAWQGEKSQMEASIKSLNEQILALNDEVKELSHMVIQKVVLHP